MVTITKYEQEQDESGQEYLMVFVWIGLVGNWPLIVVEYLEGVHEDSFDYAYLPAGICNVAA